jgi:tetratricopeptide (TPR) repeat protein
MGDDPARAEVDDVTRLWARVAETEGLERAGVLDELGGVLLEADREAEAVAVVESARDVYVQAGDDAEIARCDRNLGLLLMSIDRIEEARAHYVDACAVYDAQLLITDAAGCRQALAELAATDGRTRDALELYDRAAGAFAEAGDLVRAGWCRFDASALLLETDDVDAAAVALDDARRLFREERAYLFVARVDSLRAEVARREERFVDALELLDAARGVRVVGLRCRDGPLRRQPRRGAPRRRSPGRGDPRPRGPPRGAPLVRQRRGRRVVRPVPRPGVRRCRP